MGSARITEELAGRGMAVSERTIRYHLSTLDQLGLTENLGKRGRRITVAGAKELETARVIEKVGFLASQIDQMTYRMNFDLSAKKGAVVVNLSLINQAQLKRAAPLIVRVFQAGYSMGELVALFAPGQRFGLTVIPERMAGIATVCSITINGVLLAHGIPTYSRFGGLLEINRRRPIRFSEIITYEGTSLDPLELFIGNGLTRLSALAETGSGRIGAGFREIPADSRDQALELVERMKEAGLHGIVAVGWPGRPLLEIPVGDQRLGVVAIGGLNPIAILQETSIHVQSSALAGFAEYQDLFHYSELEARVRELD